MHFLQIRYNCFFHICVAVDKTEISSVMERQAEISKCKVSDLCEVEAINEGSDEYTSHPKTKDFDISVKVAETLPEIQKCYSSSTFCDMWLQKCREVGGGCKTLDSVITSIWKAVKESFDLLAKNIEAGETTFNEFERLFGYKFRDDLLAMKKELRNIRITPEVINTRIDQLIKYKQLETCVFGAKSILEFVKQYNLTGNFQQIRAIALYDENDMQMKAFDETLIATCESLRDLTKEQAECLKAFVDCTELISWLKKSMENGLFNNILKSYL
ncbi:E3 ubiquitin-protein ligase rnf213-beta-like [Mercenaria mercenaria]|uniref:E3 ubiquitin-protein ligase rnf213-beta-like n=1 Tax=Mercenaria mercenaria TaxID=6596 RepID=UPI00234E6D3B|nr:E3 ubiquitin-protein ligase rnf213-beta-like [Mercenaria mercenaria]